MSARAETPCQFDSYAKHVEARNREADGEATFTIEVSNVGVDPGVWTTSGLRFHLSLSQSWLMALESPRASGAGFDQWARIFRMCFFYHSLSRTMLQMFSVGHILDPYAIETTEEHEAEAIHVVMTRVLFTRLMVTVGGLMILVVGIGTMGILEFIEENVK